MHFVDRDDVICALISVAFGFSLMGCYWLGHRIRQRLPHTHRSREMTEVLIAVIAMLVTFSAIMLGLMLNSSLDKLQHLNGLVSGLADSIIRLDDTLIEYGPEARLAHVAVLNYTRREAVNLSDDASVSLTRAAMQQIGVTILQLTPPDDYRKTMRYTAIERYNDVVDLRFRTLTEGNESSNLPFNITLGLWLALTYFVFGLNSDRNPFISIALRVSMVAIIVAVFVILDMTTPLGGLISVSRAPLNHVLAQIR